MWQRQIHLPLRLGQRRSRAGGLGIVDDDHVRLLQLGPQLLRVLLVYLLVGGQELVGEGHRVALKTIVETLGDLEEILVSLDHLPAHVQTQGLFEGNQLVQDFGHAPALPGGVDVDHLESLEGRRQMAELADYAFAHHLGVLVQQIAHCALPWK